MNTKNQIQPSPLAKVNLLDKVIMGVSPRWGIERIKARITYGALGSNGFIGPGSSKRSMNGWNPRISSSADEDSIPDLPTLRAGSRDLAMNTPIATGALKRIKTNVVGGGLSLQSRINYRTLGISKEEAAIWERNTEEEFKLFCKSCDASRTQNFDEQQAMVIYNKALSGEAFAILPMIRRVGDVYQTRIKIIEADMCCNPAQGANGLTVGGGSLVEGIEYDAYDAPVKYHFLKNRYGVSNFEWTSVDAYGKKSGKPNVLHLFDPERPGQKRGIPLLAPVMDSLKQLGRYADAELMSTIISSFFTVFIKTNSPHQTGFATPYSPLGGVAPRSTDIKEEEKLALGSGAIVNLGTDQEIQLADPNRPNANFEPFFLAFCKMIGSAIEIPFEQLILHFSSSYSAARAALLEAWKKYRTERKWLVDNFCQPVYEAFLMEGIATGRIKAPGFFNDPLIAQAWSGSSWGGPGMGQIDPLKETKAARERINGLISSHEDEYIAINGGSDGGWEGCVGRLSREHDLITELGLEMNVDKPTAPTAAPGNETETDPAVPEDNADGKGFNIPNSC